MARKKKNKHIGSTLDSFLEEEGILEEVEKMAIARRENLTPRARLVTEVIHYCRMEVGRLDNLDNRSIDERKDRCPVYKKLIVVPALGARFDIQYSLTPLTENFLLTDQRYGHMLLLVHIQVDHETGERNNRTIDAYEAGSWERFFVEEDTKNSTSKRTKNTLTAQKRK